MKKQKDHVTLMPCANAKGSHKLPLMFISKSRQHIFFKNVHTSALLMLYYFKKNAWVDIEIFSNWFHQHFVPAVKKPFTDKGLSVKDLLLLPGNVLAHPDETTLLSNDNSNTALIQPMDQGVLEAMKRRYRKAIYESCCLKIRTEDRPSTL